MLAIAIILAILWFFGFVVIHIGSGFIHLILLIAIIMLLYDLIIGRDRI